MPYGQYVQPNYPAMFVVSTKATVPYPQRVRVWRGYGSSDIIDGPFEYDATAPNRVIREFHFPPDERGYNVNFKVEMLKDGIWREQGLVYDYESDGVNNRYVFYSDSISFDLRWPDATLNYIKLTLKRLDIVKLNDPDHDNEDEPFCRRKATFPQNTDWPSQSQKIQLGSLSKGEHIFPGDGHVLFEGAIGERVNIEIKVEDGDDTSGDDHIGTFTATASKSAPVARYTVGQYSTLVANDAQQTYSTAKIKMIGDSSHYELHVRATSSLRPFGPRSPTLLGNRQVSATTLTSLLLAGAAGGVLASFLISRLRRG